MRNLVFGIAMAACIATAPAAWAESDPMLETIVEQSGGAFMANTIITDLASR